MFMCEGHGCTHLQATSVKLQKEVVGLAGSEKQQAFGAGGSEANAEIVLVGRLCCLQLYKAITIEGSCGARH